MSPKYRKPVYFLTNYTEQRNLLMHLPQGNRTTILILQHTHTHTHAHPYTSTIQKAPGDGLGNHL